MIYASDIEKVKSEILKVAEKYDKASKIIVISREPAGTAQVVKLFTFGVICEPNNEELVKALMDYGMSKNNEVEFKGSFVNMQSETLVDVLQMTANIHYKQ